MFLPIRISNTLPQIIRMIYHWTLISRSSMQQFRVDKSLKFMASMMNATENMEMHLFGATVYNVSILSASVPLLMVVFFVFTVVYHQMCELSIKYVL
jgi:hypothetical protein